MKTLTPLAFAFAAVSAAAPLRAQTVVIDFDGLPGQPPPFFEGASVLPAFLIDDEYLALGVRFWSAGRGLALCAPSNPVSAPNTVTATKPGPLISYIEAAEASFWSGSTPAVVDSVSIRLTGSSSPSALDAYDCAGQLLGSAQGGGSQTLSVAFPGRIRRIEIRQGPMAFDDFTFSGLALAPLTSSAITPGTAGTTNTVEVTCATPGSQVLLVVGTAPGSTPVPGCSGLVLDMASPFVIASAKAGATEKAALRFRVPMSAAGLTLYAQALELDSCRASALTAHAFP